MNLAKIKWPSRFGNTKSVELIWIPQINRIWIIILLFLNIFMSRIVCSSEVLFNNIRMVKYIISNRHSSASIILPQHKIINFIWNCLNFDTSEVNQPKKWTKYIVHVISYNIGLKHEYLAKCIIGTNEVISSVVHTSNFCLALSNSKINGLPSLAIWRHCDHYWPHKLIIPKQ